MADQDGFETAPLVSSDEEFLDAAPETPNGLVPGSLAVRYEPELSQISMPIMSEAFMGDEVEEQGLLAATGRLRQICPIDILNCQIIVQEK